MFPQLYLPLEREKKNKKKGKKVKNHDAAPKNPGRLSSRWEKP